MLEIPFKDYFIQFLAQSGGTSDMCAEFNEDLEPPGCEVYHDGEAEVLYVSWWDTRCRTACD